MASPQLRRDGVRVPTASGVSKVPYRITAYFWIIKILTTAMGEALADFLALRYSPVLAGVVGTAVFAVALVLQFRAPRYRVWIYWFAVAMVAVWGTLAADGLHIGLGVPYAVSRAVFAVWLAAVFIAVPRPFRDWVYGLVGQYRYRWFGKLDRCMEPTAALRSRFLD